MNNNTSHIMPENHNNSRKWLFWLITILSFFVFFYLIRSILLPFILGILIAYFLDPAADKLEKMKMSRNMATTTITLAFFVSIIILSLLILPAAIHQLSGLLTDIPSYIGELENKYKDRIIGWLGNIPEDYANSIKAYASDFSGVMLKATGNIVSNLFKSGMDIVNFLSLILLTPVVAFYMLRDWDIIKLRFFALLPRKHEDVIRQQLGIIDDTLAGFIRGQINVCLLLGTFYAVGLSIAGLKFGILIGMATGLLTIIPYVGLLFGMSMGLLIAFFQFGTFSGVLTILAIFVVGQILEGNFVTPKLVGEKVGLHPLWIIFGLLAGAVLFGFVGVLIAVPATAVIGVLIRFATSKYLHSKYYLENQ